MAAWAAALVVCGAVIFAVAEAADVARPVRAALAWVPQRLHPAELEMIVAMQTPQLVIFLLSMLLLVGVLAPAVEELYYRGHLMPALGRFGAWAPIISVALFTVYHLESPWEGTARLVVVLPMAFAVWRLRSVRLGIIVHVALNTLSPVALTLVVLAAR
jgi:membrane protease YdiL (CAAX protease family)